MKKQTMIMWNHLDYLTQVKAIDLISELIEQQLDQAIKTAIAAAVTELEIWSNTPCEIVNSILNEDEDMEDEPEPWIH
jgi:hypothetical protein